MTISRKGLWPLIKRKMYSSLPETLTMNEAHVKKALDNLFQNSFSAVDQIVNMYTDEYKYGDAFIDIQEQTASIEDFEILSFDE